MSRPAGPYDIGLAAITDIDGILALQERNLPHHGGSLSVPFSREWFATAIDGQQIVVTRKGSMVVGYVVFTSVAAQAHVPIIQAMLRVRPETPTAYVYGPVCVAASERGRGVAARMFEALRARMPGRQAVAFIRSDNAASLSAHSKMGMREIGTFTQNGVSFTVVEHPG